MRQYFTSTVISIMAVFYLPTISHGQTSQCHQNDSVTLVNIAKVFFEWYISSAKANEFSEFHPIAIEDTNGMTTLDFSKYFKNLTTHSFSETLIEKEGQLYKNCINNLMQIKYADYLKLHDLDEFEKIECDYDNRYRWTGGQEMFDGYSVSNIIFDYRYPVVTGILYFNEFGQGIVSFKREIKMIFVKVFGKWKILDIQY